MNELNKLIEQYPGDQKEILEYVKTLSWGQTSKKSYDEIVSLIYKHGKAYPKKHGNWYLMPYTNSSWVQMDSWNKSVTVFEGATPSDSEVMYWSGFARGSKNKRNLGIDFGGFECVDDIEFYLEMIKAVTNE